MGDDLQVVKDAASSQLQPQLTAFQNSVDTLKTAISSVRTDGVSAVITAASNAVKAGSTLVTDLSDVKCG